MRFDFLYKICLRRNERDTIKLSIGLRVNYPSFLSDFNENWIFAAQFRKNHHIANFMKIRPMGAQLFHADGRTWRSQQSLFAILRTCLKIVIIQKRPHLIVEDLKKHNCNRVPGLVKLQVSLHSIDIWKSNQHCDSSIIRFNTAPILTA